MYEILTMWLCHIILNHSCMPMKEGKVKEHPSKINK